MTMNYMPAFVGGKEGIASLFGCLWVRIWPAPDFGRSFRQISRRKIQGLNHLLQRAPGCGGAGADHLEAGDESCFSGFRKHAGFPDEPFAVQDLDRPIADPDEALAAQGLELLVDAFPRCTDHGSQILLRDLHPDPDLPLLPDAEGVSEVEDLFCQTGRDVQKIPFRKKHIRVADSACKTLDDLLGHFKPIAHESQEIFPMQTEGFRVFQGLYCGGAGFAVEERELSQQVAAGEYRQDQLLSG